MIRARLIASAALAAVLAVGGEALALPSSPVITGTNGPGPGATFTFGTNTLTVNQTNSRVFVDWSSFNIASGETVTFSQPSNTAIALNRVAANSFTTIAGSLNANGSVWIISPAGILVGAGAAVNVGSFLASTSVADSTTLSDFLCNCNGTVRFSPQAVTATPSITVQPGAAINANAGFVELNSVSITQNGTVSASDAVEYLAIPSAKVDFDSGPNGLTNPNVDVNKIAATQNQATSIVHGGVTTAGGFVALETFNDPSLGAPAASVINLSGHVTANGILTDPETGSIFGVILVGDGGSLSTNSQFAVPASAATVVDASGGAITSTWAIGAEAGTVKTGVWTSGANTGAGFDIEAGAGGLDVPHALNFTGVGAVSLSSLGSLSIEGPITNSADGGISLSSAAFSLASTGSITNNHGPLSLTASGPMTIDGAITPSGEGASLVESGSNPVVLNGSFGAAGDLGQGVSLAFTGAPDSGQALTINGQAYGLIFNQTELAAINSNLAGHYALAAPLDLTGTGFGGAPIASLANTPFTGTFTGLGNTISHLTIIDKNQVAQTALVTPTTGVVGLFGAVGPGGMVEDVSLANAAVQGPNGAIVGALVGSLAGTVLRSSSSGTVETGGNVNTTGGGFAIVGGLVGTSDGSILSSHSSATVVGGDAQAGGLLGGAISGAVISGSYATGVVGVGASATPQVVTATAGGLIGSLAGFQGGASPVTVTSSYATGHVFGGAASVVGGFAGVAAAAQISGSYSTGAVTQTAPGTAAGSDIIGGFVGLMFTGGTVANAYSSGAVHSVGGSSASFDTLAGGFIGAAQQGATISTSYALGAVVLTGANASAQGGFAGSISSGASVDHVYASGSVTGPGGIGGLVGNLNTGSVSDAYWDEGTTGQTTAVGFNQGGAATNLVGVGGSTGRSPYAASSYANFDLVNTWFMIDGSTRPMLRSEYSTTITNAHQLQLMSMNLGAAYTLGGDIDMSEDTSAAGVWDPASGFVPVGPDPAVPFVGVLDGAGHTISNLTITRTTPVNQIVFGGYASNGFAGLFGFVGHGGTVENLALANANVTGGDGMAVGAVAGTVQGTLVNVSTAGAVTVGNGVSTGLGYAGAYAGGLSGTFDGLIIASGSSATVTGGDAAAGGLVGSTGANAGLPAGRILFSHATGAVSVSGAPGAGQQIPSAGGLVGTLYGYQFGGVNPNPDSIAVSYATGNVTGGGGSVVGGLVGSVIQGSVTASYATGAVTQTAGGQNGQDDLAGGFVGYVGVGSIVDKSYASGAVATVGGATNALYTLAGGFVGDVDQSAFIEKDYSLGAVTAGGSTFSLVGGFAGIILNSGSVNQVYATGLVTSPGTVGGLVGVLGNPGFVSNSYWDEGTTGRTNAIGGGAGSAVNLVGVGGSTGLSPYAQATYAALDFGSQNSGDWVIIPGETRPMLHAEFSTTITDGHQLQLMALAPGGDFTIAADIDMSETASAAGVWNPANGFVPVGGNGQAAFTGALDGQGHTISNLTIIDTTPVLQNDGINTNGAVGLFGYLNGGALIQNVNLANAHVTGGDGMRVGALAGIQGAGSIVNDSSSGIVATGSTTTNGGAAVVASAGGLVGAAAGSILQSHASATVSGVSAYAGGLVGSFFGSVLSDSYATGAVSVGNYSGFAGSGALAGGLVGLVNTPASGVPFTVSDSYATGQVSGGAGSEIGGFAGFVGIQGLVTRSYATGTVTQTGGGQNGESDFAGGFVGVLSGPTITQSFASGAVTTTGGPSGLPTYAGGFAGGVDSGAVANAYSTGQVTSAGSSFAALGGFAGIVEESGGVDRVYATGAVSGPGQLAGLVGQLGNAAQTDASGALTNSYWDEGTSGQTTGFHLSGTGAATSVTGVGGSTGISPFVAATYAGWDFSNIWSPPSAGFYPELYGVSHVIRITAGTVSLLYGTFPMETWRVYGLQSGDDASIVRGLNFTLAGATTASSGFYNVGVYPFSFSGATASDASGAYRLIYVSGSLTFTPRPLAASLAGTVEKTYDGTTTAALAAANYQLAGGVVSGDSVALNDPTTGAYDTKDAASGKLVSVAGLLLTGTDAANYTVNGSASAAIGIIDPKLLAASLTGTVQKTYDGTTAATLAAPNFQLAGVIGGDSVALNDPAGGTYDTKNVGTAKLVSVSGLVLTGANAADYTVNSAASAAIGVIDPKSLTVSLIGQVQKTYDGGTSATLAAGNYQLGGVIGGDSVTLNDPGSGAYAGKDVGSGLVVSVSGLALSGTDAANYSVIGSVSGPVGIIDPKALTASLVGTVQKPFDGTTTATLAVSNYQLAGVIGGDSVSLNDPASGAYDTAAAGAGKVVTVSGLALSGAAASDYSVNGSASAPIGTITAVAAVAPPIQVQIVTVPTQTALTQLSDVSPPASGAQSPGGGETAGAAPPDAGPTAGADQSAGADQTASADQTTGAPSSGAPSSSADQGASGTEVAGGAQTASASGPPGGAEVGGQTSTAAIADADAAAQTSASPGQSAQVGVFPVARSAPSGRRSGDGSPVTGAGNGDLWTGSDLGGAKP